jgi:exopolysaccharide biosynthesis polyprenyl glycosylphosphotransferase
MNKRRQIFLHVALDFLSALISWAVFYILRKLFIDSQKYGEDLLIETNIQFYKGLILVPIFWLALYALTGTYTNIFRRSRLKELGQTLLITLIGVIIIFFTLLLDDNVVSYVNYYQSFLMLYVCHFSFTYIPRFIISTNIVKKVHNRVYGFKTIIVGSNEKALQLFLEEENRDVSSGNKFVGFVHVDNNIHLLENHIKHYGSYEDLTSIIKENNIEEAIIAVESSEHENLGKIINMLSDTDVIIKIIPDMYDILVGSVKMTSIFDAPLIIIDRNIMPSWQKFLKRALDIFTSVIVLALLFPFFLIIGIIIIIDSKGSIIYKQERMGKNGKPFNIYKFRSMFTDAEIAGPALSSDDDPRITPVGKLLRKYRIDELPNFYNVLKGEMTLVGPRPERKFFINQIMKKAPHYSHLQKLTPGITSWGQVKYGYAENVDEMIERLKYDILYIENMSLFVDLKILIYTVIIVFKGRGK